VSGGPLPSRAGKPPVAPNRSPPIASQLLRCKTTPARMLCAPVVADAGYDSEDAHVYARQILGIRSIIPSTIGRPSAKLPTGYYRRLMRRRFDRKKYGQRWQAETVTSMIKRNLGSALRARKYRTQGREIMLRVLAHNIMIVRFSWGFLQSKDISILARKGPGENQRFRCIEDVWPQCKPNRGPRFWCRPETSGPISTLRRSQSNRIPRAEYRRRCARSIVCIGRVVVSTPIRFAHFAQFRRLHRRS
jgi:hypothetical protein